MSELFIRFEQESITDLPALAAALGLPPAGWRTLPPALLEYPKTGPRFRFVGLVGGPSGLLVVLPKYLRSRTAAEWATPGATQRDEARRLLRVLHYFRRQPLPTLSVEYNESEDNSLQLSGEVSVAFALLDDYLENSYWQRIEQEVTTWDGARPDWPRTLSRAQPLHTQGGSPLYLARYGHRQPSGVENTISVLHRWAVRYCLHTYGELLPDYDGLTADLDAPATLDDIGPVDQLDHLLRQEERTVFRDSQLYTLRLLRQLLNSQVPSNPTALSGSLFGTTAFHVVWEVACQAAFANRLAEVQAILPTPIWTAANGQTYQNAHNRLIPDIVSFTETHLLIADAKYYTPIFNESGTITGNPGMPDISKQVLYEQALTSLLPAAIPPRTVQNIFLLPASRPPSTIPESPTEWWWGTVCPNIPGWKNKQVEIWQVPPQLIFQAYLNRKELFLLV